VLCGNRFGQEEPRADGLGLVGLAFLRQIGRAVFQRRDQLFLAGLDGSASLPLASFSNC